MSRKKQKLLCPYHGRVLLRIFALLDTEVTYDFHEALEDLFRTHYNKKCLHCAATTKLAYMTGGTQGGTTEEAK